MRDSRKSGDRLGGGFEMNLRCGVTVLAHAAICMALAVPRTGSATTCLRIDPKEFLERPALIFEGTIQGRVVRDNHFVTSYTIDVLYKGLVDGDTVDIVSHCGVVGEC